MWGNLENKAAEWKITNMGLLSLKFLSFSFSLLSQNGNFKLKKNKKNLCKSENYQNPELKMEVFLNLGYKVTQEILQEKKNEMVFKNKNFTNILHYKQIEHTKQ